MPREPAPAQQGTPLPLHGLDQVETVADLRQGSVFLVEVVLFENPVPADLAEFALDEIDDLNWLNSFKKGKKSLAGGLFYPNRTAFFPSDVPVARYNMGTKPFLKCWRIAVK